MTAIKICGLTQPEHVAFCASLGVDFVGFVAYAKSPRHVTPEQFHALLPYCGQAQPVLVTVDVGDEMLEEYLSPLTLAPSPARRRRHRLPSPLRERVNCEHERARREMGPIILQLHGNESPARLRAIRARYGCSLIRAITDPLQAATYAACAEYLLIDAPPVPGELPGGNAKRLDWAALRGFSPALPWFLSGGLNVGNVAAALHVTGTTMLDVSSGVERQRGVKDLALIEEFVHAARKASRP